MKFWKKPASIQNEERIYYTSIFLKKFGDVFDVQSKNVKHGSQKFIENNIKNVASSQPNSHGGEERLF